MAAVSTSTVQSTVFGNLRVTYGAFTATQNAASVTLDVGGGNVWLCAFVSQDTTGAMAMSLPRFSTSTSGAVTTITLYLQDGVTTGHFIVVHS